MRTVAEDDLRATPAHNSDSNGRGWLRLGGWTLAAIIAVAVAVLVGGSENGLRRLAGALPDVQALPPQQALRDDGEMQKLSESLRQINTDRIRMITRLEAIERQLDEITGSINRGNAGPGATPAVIPENPPAAENPGAAPAGPPGAIVPAPQQQQAVQSPPAAEGAPTETPASSKYDFGVDLGSAQTVDGLRMLWTQVKSRHGTLLEGMRPIIVIREPARAGAVELRLVVGPIPSASLAAKLCVAMNAAGALCQPAVFDGQRLALR
jgi:hypothetical protein